MNIDGILKNREIPKFFLDKLETICAEVCEGEEILFAIVGDLTLGAKYGTELFVHKKSKSDEASSKDVLAKVIPIFEALENWDDESILDAMVKLAEAEGAKNAKIMWPVRIAAAGKLVTPGGAVEICQILGKDETLRRLRAGLAMLQA